jgi:hypothetical protein
MSVVGGQLQSHLGWVIPAAIRNHLGLWYLAVKVTSFG